MRDEIRQFVLQSLTEMNYDIEGVGDDTTLGPSGADLESLGISELAVRVEDQFGVKFTEDEAEELAGMTIGEFCMAVAGRLQVASTAAASTTAASTPAASTPAAQSRGE